MLRRAIDPVLLWWRARGTLTQDGILAAALAVLAFLPGLVDNGVDLAEFPHRRLDAVGVGLALAQCVPLVLRRIAPLACVAVFAVVFPAVQMLAYRPSFASESMLVVLYSVGAYLSSRWLLVAGVGWYAGLCVALHALGSRQTLAQYLTFFLMMGVCWAAGRWMRSYRGAVEARRVHSAQLAVAEERARIARELHDVVTHHVAAMVVQSDAAQYLVPSAPDRAVDGLAAIGDTGRRALSELRMLLDVLDGNGSGASIEELVAGVRSAGQPVEFVQQGVPVGLSDGVALVAYRVVQEALTNAVKYASGRETLVRLDYTSEEVAVCVTNEPAASPPALGGSGRGLSGVRARVSAVGGSVVAGPLADGGFSVSARLPVRRTAR